MTLVNLHLLGILVSLPRDRGLPGGEDALRSRRGDSDRIQVKNGFPTFF